MSIAIGKQQHIIEIFNPIAWGPHVWFFSVPIFIEDGTDNALKIPETNEVKIMNKDLPIGPYLNGR